MCTPSWFKSWGLFTQVCPSSSWTFFSRRLQVICLLVLALEHSLAVNRNWTYFSVWDLAGWYIKTFPEVFLSPLIEIPTFFQTYKMSCDIYWVLSLKALNLLIDKCPFGEQRIPAKHSLPLNNFQGTQMARAFGP